MYPVITKRYFNVYMTSSQLYGRCKDVATTLCAYWVRRLFLCEFCFECFLLHVISLLQEYELWWYGMHRDDKKEEKKCLKKSFGAYCLKFSPECKWKNKHPLKYVTTTFYASNVAYLTISTSNDVLGSSKNTYIQSNDVSCKKTYTLKQWFPTRTGKLFV